MSNTLTLGSIAPDASLLQENGEETSLAPFWAQGPTLLTFLRHFG